MSIIYKFGSTTLDGLVRRNPYGNWSDVDKGLYIDDDNIDNFIENNYKGRRIKITIEVLEEEVEEK